MSTHQPENVTLPYVCTTDDCFMKGEEKHVPLCDIFEVGNPICSECEEELTIKNVEVKDRKMMVVEFWYDPDNRSIQCHETKETVLDSICVEIRGFADWTDYLPSSVAKLREAVEKNDVRKVIRVWNGMSTFQIKLSEEPLFTKKIHIPEQDWNWPDFCNSCGEFAEENHSDCQFCGEAVCTFCDTRREENNNHCTCAKCGS